MGSWSCKNLRNILQGETPVMNIDEMRGREYPLFSFILFS